MSNFTALELTVLDAIADESVEVAPELPGQIADARVIARTNDGSAVFAGIEVDPSRAAPIRSASARLGPVHVDVAGLEEPLRFDAILEDGFLAGLKGTAYREDLSALDLRSATASRLYRTAPEGDLVEIPPRMPFELAIHRVQREEEWERNPFSIPAYPLPPDRTPGFRLSLTRGLVRRMRASPAGARALELLGHPAPWPLLALLTAIELGLFALLILIVLGLDRRLPWVGAAFARLEIGDPSALLFPLLIAVMVLGQLLRLRRQEVRRRKALQQHDGR